MSYIHSQLVLLIAFVLTIIPELAVVERKYNIFRGGYLQSHTLDSAGEIALFLLFLIYCHLALLVFVYWGFRKIYRKTHEKTVFYYNFLCFTVIGMGIFLAVKFKVLSYFSDAISFHLIQKLGGGSMLDSLLYVVEEGAVIIWAIFACSIFYWLGLKFLHIRLKRSEITLTSSKTHSHPNRLFLLIAVFLGVLPMLLLVANNNRNVRYALNQFLSFQIINTALAKVTDFDGDGFSYFTNLSDGAPFNGAIHPMALDYPSNGIDEDGFAGDFVLIEETVPVPSVLDVHPQKNVVLIVLESVRGDLLEQKVNGLTVAPNLTALAETGTQVKQVYSHVGYTSPSLKSLFSGSLSTTHNGQSIFRDLKSKGYQIAVFSGQSERFGEIAESVSMHENSDYFVDAEVLKAQRAFAFAAKGSLLIDGQVLLREFDAVFGTPDIWKQPTFIYFNFQSAHFPYFHNGMKNLLDVDPLPRSEISIDHSARLAGTYWNAVAYADWLVGQVITRLKKLGIYDDTIVVITADHGESLFDDGFLGHGHALNRQQTHIPLIINQPRLKINGPLGLSNIYELLKGILDGTVGDRQPSFSARNSRVFQFIGSLDRPRKIGLIESDRRWTILDLQTQMVQFVDLKKIAYYPELAGEPGLKVRADRLIFEWEKHRWNTHLSSK